MTGTGPSARGAILASDGIPLHYGDRAGEYHAALNAAVLMDRSHEGRLLLSGRDRLALLQRLSTNDVERLPPGRGAPTVFTSPIGRILDRVTVVARADDAVVLTEPGRGPAVQGLIQRNIFFQDDVKVADWAPRTRQFVLLGPQADALFESADDASISSEQVTGRNLTIAGADCFVTRLKPMLHDLWSVIVPAGDADTVWEALLVAGEATGLRPAGSLTYHVLRVRSGRPAGRELTSDYLPLEVGLWDEVSFTKGCYTGQEIIARMESRGRLARTFVALRLSAPVDAPAPLLADGREVGTLTSVAEAPDGAVYGLGVVRSTAAEPGASLTAGGVAAVIDHLAGAQPAFSASQQPD